MGEALNPELVLSLRVQAASFVAADIRQFDLVDPAGTKLPEFAPGAHLLVQTPSGVTRRSMPGRCRNASSAPWAASWLAMPQAMDWWLATPVMTPRLPFIRVPVGI